MTNAAIHNFTVNQGATLRRQFRWTVAGQPVDLAGYRVHSQWRLKVTSPDALADLTTENGGIEITDPASGVFALSMSAEQTSALSFKTAVYDIELISPAGVVTRLLAGTVTLSLEVTR